MLATWRTKRNLLVVLSACLSLHGQTTQGLISGEVTNRLSHAALSGVQVDCTNAGTHHVDQATTDAHGYYALPLLSPGTYLLVAKKDGFQSGLYRLDLSISSSLTVDFDLRPLWDVWGNESYRYEHTSNDRLVNFYGLDAAVVRASGLRLFNPQATPLYSSVSYVVDREWMENVPLAGRDAYAILALQPGVSSDAPTARGLGLSVNGQRPSASNFLLDGIEANNYLLSGPLVTLPPEAVQEYRFSTNNFSAEYGRTAGFLANSNRQNRIGARNMSAPPSGADMVSSPRHVRKEPPVAEVGVTGFSSENAARQSDSNIEGRDIPRYSPRVGEAR